MNRSKVSRTSPPSIVPGGSIAWIRGPGSPAPAAPRDLPRRVGAPGRARIAGVCSDEDGRILDERGVGMLGIRLEPDHLDPGGSRAWTYPSCCSSASAGREDPAPRGDPFPNVAEGGRTMALSIMEPSWYPGGPPGAAERFQEGTNRSRESPAPRCAPCGRCARGAGCGSRDSFADHAANFSE